VTDTQRPRRSPTSAELRIWREFIETVEALSWRLAGRLQSLVAARRGLGDVRRHTRLSWETARVLTLAGPGPGPGQRPGPGLA
jgi:hypothetical protein